MPPVDRLRLAFLGDPNSVHTRRWLTWFAERGHEVILLEGFGAEIALDLDERIGVERYQAFPHRRAPFLSSLHARRELRQLIDRLRPDVLHAHFVRRFGWQGSLSGFHPFVVSPWGSDLLVVPRRAWRTRWWNRRALRSADLVTVTTEHMRSAALRSGAWPDRVEMVQHGVDTQRFAPGPPPPQLVGRLALGDAAMIFSPRMIRPLYRHETIIEAFAELSGDPVLVMSAAGANAAYMAALRDQMRSLDVTDRVRVLDAIAHDEMPGYFRAARVVVSVPESDSFPVSLLEAMACATPVVASDLPPARAVLEPIARGSVVPVGDAPSLTAVLRRVLAMSADDRRRLGDALRGHVVQVADYEANMARMEGLYRRLAGRA